MTQNRPQGNKDSDLLFSALSRLEMRTPEQQRLQEAATNIADPGAVDNLRELLKDKFFARIENADAERQLLSQLGAQFEALSEKNRMCFGVEFSSLDQVLRCMPDRQEFFAGIASLETPRILGLLDQNLIVIDGGSDTPVHTRDTTYDTAWKNSRRRSFVDSTGRKKVIDRGASNNGDEKTTLYTRGLITEPEAKMAVDLVQRDVGYNLDNSQWEDDSIFTFFEQGEIPPVAKAGGHVYEGESRVTLRMRAGRTEEGGIWNLSKPFSGGYLSAVRFTLYEKGIA